MDNTEIIRSKRALVAGQVRTVMQLGRELRLRRTKRDELTTLQSREDELRKQRESIHNRGTRLTAAGVSSKNHIARRQLQESVAQLALLDVLCHLDKINKSKKEETNLALDSCSIELERLNRVRELFTSRAGQVEATERLAVELAE